MQKIDPELINKIYPSPKTADEARAERSERQSLLYSRRSAHPRLQIAFILSGVLGLVALYIYFFQAIFLSSIMGFSLVSLIGLILVWLILSAIKKIRKIVES